MDFSLCAGWFSIPTADFLWDCGEPGSRGRPASENPSACQTMREHKGVNDKQMKGGFPTPARALWFLACLPRFLLPTCLLSSSPPPEVATLRRFPSFPSGFSSLAAQKDNHTSSSAPPLCLTPRIGRIPVILSVFLACLSLRWRADRCRRGTMRICISGAPPPQGVPPDPHPNPVHAGI